MMGDASARMNDSCAWEKREGGEDMARETQGWPYAIRESKGSLYGEQTFLIWEDAVNKVKLCI
jgi:hypothetical protein